MKMAIRLPSKMNQNRPISILLFKKTIDNATGKGYGGYLLSSKLRSPIQLATVVYFIDDKSVVLMGPITSWPIQ